MMVNSLLRALNYTLHDRVGGCPALRLGCLRPGKSSGLALPRIRSELMKCCTQYSRLIFKLTILYAHK